MAVYVDGQLVGDDSVPITTERSFNAETFTFEATYPFTVAIEAKDFEKGQNKNDKPLEWSKISTFTITLTDDKTKQKIKLASPDGSGVLKSIELVKP